MAINTHTGSTLTSMVPEISLKLSADTDASIESTSLDSDLTVHRSICPLCGEVRLIL